MTTRDDRADGAALLGRTLHAVTQLLESADNPDERVRRVLERLRDVVPYEQCALLDAQVGHELRVIVVPEPASDERVLLTTRLVHIFGQLTSAPPSSALAAPEWLHLAAPLVGLDEVIGLLFVRTSVVEYTEVHLRLLSVIAAKLAAYLTMMSGRAERAELVRDRDGARRIGEAASLAKDDFLALVSRDLKTPLTSILTWTHRLRSMTDDAERARAIAEVESNVHEQAKLIDDIVDLACASPLNLRVMEPASLIKTVLDGLRVEAERRSILIDAELDAVTMPLVLDPDRIARVVSILVANAINFTPPGGRIAVRLERAARCARIRVSDSGSTVSREALAHLFDRFAGAAAAGPRADAGLGVGLAMVKGLVELHGGLVSVESEAGHGTTFIVELPHAPDPGRPSGVRGDGRLLTGVRVLFVDHDLGLRESFQAVLEDQGAEVTAVATAPDALTALARSRPDVLLFGDLATPGEGVFNLMHEVTARISTLPAASISSWRLDEREREIAAGFRLHLRKPIEIGELLDAVADLAGRKTTKTPVVPAGGEKNRS